MARTPLHLGLRDQVFGIADGAWDLQRCTTCGAAYLDPPPQALHETYAGEYYTHAAPDVEPAPAGAAGRLRRALRNGYLAHSIGARLQPATAAGRVVVPLLPRIRAETDRDFRHLAPPGRLLDVGCGNGTFVARALGAGWAAAGIDVDAAAVAAGQAAGLDVAVELLEDHPGRDYDVICMDHVIEHVADPLALLSAARERLRPGGRLWLATPNLDALGHRRFGRSWLHLDPPRHLVLFGDGSLRRALATTGFTDVRPNRVAPLAGVAFAYSAAIARGELPAANLPASRADRLRAAVAERVERHRPAVAEELCVTARI